MSISCLLLTVLLTMAGLPASGVTLHPTVPPGASVVSAEVARASRMGSFVPDPRDCPLDPSLPAKDPVSEGATEEQEEESGASGGLFAWHADCWQFLSAPGLVSAGSLVLPGGKVLPRLLPNLRC